MKKSLLSQKADDANPMIPEKKSTIHKQIPYNGEEFVAQNNSAFAESLFEPHTFGFPSFFEEQFKATGHQPYFSNPMMQMLTDDNCCCFDKLMIPSSSDFPCIDEFVVPEQNLFC